METTTNKRIGVVVVDHKKYERTVMPTKSLKNAFRLKKCALFGPPYVQFYTKLGFEDTVFRTVAVRFLSFGVIFRVPWNTVCGFTVL